MPPPAPTYVYTDRAGVEWIMGQCGVNLRINDSETTVVSATEEIFLTNSINVASAEIDMYASGRYAPAVMASSWIIYMWASVMAAYRTAIRRCGNAPASLQFEYESARQSLKDIQNGQLMIAGLPSLATAGCQMSNVRLDPRFATTQMRVERAISDSTPTNAPRFSDMTGWWLANYPVSPVGTV